MTYEQALSAIHEIPWKSKNPGLDRITELMHLMGDPQGKLRYRSAIIYTVLQTLRKLEFIEIMIRMITISVIH